MPMMEQATRWATNRMPKAINPTAHAVIDYAMAASFFGMAAFFWKRNKRAAISSLIMGAANVTTSLLTDYPGGVVNAISFQTHGRMDFGLAGVIASLPDTMRFSDEPESRFFRFQGMAMAAVTGLTDFTGTGERNQLERLEGAA